MKNKTIAIIGAGVAGLSMAYVLNKFGYNFQVFEKADEHRDNGLGFLIMANGLSIFEKLDLTDTICPTGNFITNYFSEDINSNVLKENVVEGCLAITRDNFIKGVSATVPNDRIHYNKTLVDLRYYSTSNKSSLLFEDGSTYDFDLIIGADGIHSNVRKFVHPEKQKKVAGYIEIVGWIEDEELFKECGHTFRKLHNKKAGYNMGVVASENNKAIWFLQIDSSKYFLPENKKSALKLFANIVLKNASPFFKKIVERYNEKDGYLWNLYDVDIAPTFYKDNIVLIGDAAHPLLSFTSQGVNSALEDIDFLINLMIESDNDSTSLDVEKFNFERIKTNSNYIIEGRALMDRFLFPEKYNNDIEPFIQA